MSKVVNTLGQQRNVDGSNIGIFVDTVEFGDYVWVP